MENEGSIYRFLARHPEFAVMEIPKAELGIDGDGVWEYLTEETLGGETTPDSSRQEEIAKTLRINPYRVKKALSVADKFSDKKLKEILTQLYQIDRNIKTGQMEQTLALELLIGRI